MLTQTVTEYDTLAEAELAGQHAGCLAGTTRVEVRSPDGNLQALWDKKSTETRRSVWFVDDHGTEHFDVEHVSSLWQRLGPESVQLGLGQAGRDLPPAV